MRCSDVPELLDAYLADALDEPRRSAFRSHLRSCASCREAALRTDPTLLFAAAPAGEPDPARVEELARSVMAQVRQQRMQRRLGHRPAWLAAAAAVVLALVGIAGWRLLSPGTATAPAVTAARAAEAPSPPPRIEVDMAGEGVRVYQYADQQDGDTAVIFIVNPQLEL